MSRLGTILLALALPAGAFLGGVRLMSSLSGRHEPPAGQTPLMQRWRGYGAAAVADYWGGFDKAGLEGEHRFLRLDLAFPLVYGGTLLAGLLLLSRAPGRAFPPGFLVGAVALTMMSDWAENLVQLRLLAEYRSHQPLSEPWVAVASVATVVKLAAFAASALGLVALAVRLARAPAPEPR